jgi:hypothetical protein
MNDVEPDSDTSAESEIIVSLNNSGSRTIDDARFGPGSTAVVPEATQNVVSEYATDLTAATLCSLTSTRIDVICDSSKSVTKEENVVHLRDRCMTPVALNDDSDSQGDETQYIEPVTPEQERMYKLSEEIKADSANGSSFSIAKAAAFVDSSSKSFPTFDSKTFCSKSISPFLVSTMMTSMMPCHENIPDDLDSASIESASVIKKLPTDLSVMAVNSACESTKWLNEDKTLSASTYRSRYSSQIPAIENEAQRTPANDEHVEEVRQFFVFVS